MCQGGTTMKKMEVKTAKGIKRIEAGKDYIMNFDPSDFSTDDDIVFVRFVGIEEGLYAFRFPDGEKIMFNKKEMRELCIERGIYK
jgi:hypothetical protein